MFDIAKHCVKSVRIRSYSGQYFPHFPAFELNTGKCFLRSIKYVSDKCNEDEGDTLSTA